MSTTHYLLAQTSHIFDAGDTGTTIVEETGLGSTNPQVAVAAVISAVLGFLALVAVVLIIYAGFRWMTSGGNEDTVEKAKKTLIASAIGLAIILGAYGIALYVFTQLEGATGFGMNSLVQFFA